MNVKLSKKKKTIVILVILVIIIGIGGMLYYRILKNQSPKENGFNLHVSSDKKEEIDIPDPSETKGIADVTLCEFDEFWDWDETIFDVNPMVDLSFLGLKEKACVISYAKVNTNGSSKANALALILGTKSSEYGYLALLDYQNGKSYLTKTALLISDSDPQLNVCDLTDDGKDELIISGVANDWLEWQIYRFADENIKELYIGNYEKGENITNDLSTAFDIKFILDDRIKISGKGFDFEKEIDVSDIKEEVGEEWHQSAMLIASVFKDGEIFYDYFQNIDSEQGLCVPLDLEVYKGYICAEANVYLKYDKDTDTMEIRRIGFKEVRR